MQSMFSNLYLYLCMAFTAESISAISYLQFDGIGYERCTYNAFEGYGRVLYENTDIVHQVLASNQAEARPWTVEMYSGSKEIEVPYPLKQGEICSVNIITHPGFIGISMMLRPRPLLQGHFFVHIVHEYFFSSYRRQGLKSVELITVPIIVIVHNFQRIKHHFLIGASVGPVETEPTMSLKELSDRWRKLSNHFHSEPIEITAFDYPSNSFKCKHIFSASVPERYKRCREHFMIGLTLAQHLNFTPVYSNTYLYSPKLQKELNMYGPVLPHLCVKAVWTCIGRISFGIYPRRASTDKVEFWSALILESTEEPFLYCMKYARRETFYLDFWIKPFGMDIWGNVLLILSITEILFPILDWHLRNFRLKFPLWAQVVFSFVYLTLWWHYECCISSKLTVVPSVIKINSFEELIRGGYKVIGIQPGTDLGELKEVFHKAGIANRFSESIIFSKGGEKRNFLRRSFAQYNATRPMLKEFCLGILRELRDVYKRPHCYMLEIDKVRKAHLIHYGGHAKDTLRAISVRLLESGYISKCYETINFAQEGNYWAYTREEEIKKYDEANAPVAFKLTEWKIASLFAGLALLLSISTLSYLLDDIFRIRRQRVVAIVAK